MRRLDRSQFDIAIVDALLGEKAAPGRAQAILERAGRLGCDPLTVLVHATHEDQDRVYSRAAALFDLPYTDDIAPFIAPFPADANIDAFAGLRAIRGRMRGADTLFVAPRLDQFAVLAARRKGARRIVITSPGALEAAIVKVNADRLALEAVQYTMCRYPDGVANTELRKSHRYGLLVTIAGAMLAALAAPFAVQLAVLPVLTALLILPSLFRLWAAATAEANVPLIPETLLGDAALPVYSVLVPLRDEAHMVCQMVRALKRLDYPPEKLDIKFVVESASPRTIGAVRRYLDDARFSLVVVPRRPPHTKPKALNFALPLARGRYVTVFDAEDVPERQQLRKAASLFARHRDIACLQAHLLVTNTGRHWIARMFAAEYAGHFGLLLPAIARTGLPMPLGGTSNHFRIDTLRAAGGWDAFNVTEDADLGIRFGRLGHRIASFASYTSEESTITVKAWLGQRSRWMKGWMQTLIVHNARPGKLLADLGWRNLFAFQVLVGGMVFSISVHGVLLAATVFRLVSEGAPGPGLWVSLSVLGVGYLGAIAASMVGLARIGRRDLMGWLVLMPAYWLLAWVATLRAAVDLIRKPYHWVKTHHSGTQWMPVEQPVPADARSVAVSGSADAI